MEHEEAARLAGLSRSAAYEWHNRYEEGGSKDCVTGPVRVGHHGSMR
jgi:transposase